jgi:hypothetical protein
VSRLMVVHFRLGICSRVLVVDLGGLCLVTWKLVFL